MQIQKIKISNIQENLLKTIVFCLPFTQLFTLPVGFPLKVYELCLFALIGSFLVSGRFPFKVRDILITILAAFSVVGLFTLVINMVDFYPYQLTKTETRFGYFGDSILKYFYFLMCMIAFVCFYQAKNSFKYTMLGIYVKGGYVAAFISFYLFISSALKLPIISLPGYDPQMWMWFVRNGTFKEGNYLAAYLLTCIGVSLYLKKRWGVVILLLALLTTISTAGIITSIGLVALNFFELKITKLVKYKKVVVAAIFAVILFMVMLTPVFQDIVLSKLSFSKGDAIESNKDYSRVERTNQSRVAFKMGVVNPFFGVGLSNYSRHYKQYNNDKRFDYTSTFKPIPNNVYAELFAEWGFLGLLSFLTFSFFLLRCTAIRILKLTYLMLLVYFLAFPTFTLLFIWVFAALITIKE